MSRGGYAAGYAATTAAPAAGAQASQSDTRQWLSDEGAAQSGTLYNRASAGELRQEQFRSGLQLARETLFVH